MRDIISHHYFDVDPAQVLWIVTNELSPLKAAIAHFRPIAHFAGWNTP
jgi:uncharacterized protein with HEPN domain